jgi:hypothetical protein
MPEVLEESRLAGSMDPRAPAPPGAAPPLAEQRAREDLRTQIGSLERELGRTFAAAFPRQGIDWRVGAVGGPRLLSIGELERVRDALAYRLGEARGELAHRIDREHAGRELLEEMIAAPERHRWVRISNQDIGEPGCRHWHARPRWGLLGMLLNWWRVRISSGCPLPAAGRPRPPRRRPAHPRRACPDSAPMRG